MTPLTPLNRQEPKLQFQNLSSTGKKSEGTLPIQWTGKRFFKIKTPTIRNPGIGIGFKNPADSMDWEPISKHFKNFSLGKWGYINGVYIRGG